MSQPNMACGRIATTWGRVRDDAWKGARQRGEGRVMTRGRARDDTWKGARRHVEGRATTRGRVRDDAWMGVTTRDKRGKGGEGCRDASQDDERRVP